VATGPRKPRPRKLRLVVLAVFAIGIFLSMGAQFDGCDNQPDPDGPFIDLPSGSDVEANAASSTGEYCRNKKLNLMNERSDGFTDEDGYHEYWYAYTSTDWGYILDDPYCVNKGKVRWRHTSPYCHAVKTYISTYECDFFPQGAGCYDPAQTSGNRQCITRLAAGFEVGISIEGLPTNVRFNRCIATRIGPGGLHHRVIHKEHCDEIVGAAAQADMTGADDQEGAASGATTMSLSKDSAISPFGDTPALRLARLKRDHPALNDFVSREQERRLEVVCAESYDQCKELATKLYRSLSPERRRQVREAMSSTIGK